METVRKDITVSATPKTVFELLTDPTVQSEIAPVRTIFQERQQQPDGGCRAEYACRVFGLSASGEVKTTDYTPNRRLIWALTGDFQGTVRWYLTPVENTSRTEVSVAATYGVPGLSFLQRVAAPLIRRYVARKADHFLRRMHEQLG